jgi:hypothetical protein
VSHGAAQEPHGALAFQLVIDCREPHELADWWAETLRWDVEEQDETFIRSMVDQGEASMADTTTHRGRLVWASGSALNPPTGAAGGPRILFQQVPEGKAVKNRLHLDLRLPGDDVERFRDELVARGARVLHTGRQGPHTWTTMAEPEGNEFCV